MSEAFGGSSLKTKVIENGKKSRNNLEYMHNLRHHAEKHFNSGNRRFEKDFNRWGAQKGVDR